MGRLVINYISQLHHTANHWRPGLLAPDCTFPDGVDRVRRAYNELVQAYRALCDWPAADAEHDPGAANNGRTAVQLLNLAYGNQPLVNHNRVLNLFANLGQDRKTNLELIRHIFVNFGCRLNNQARDPRQGPAD